MPPDDDDPPTIFHLEQWWGGDDDAFAVLYERLAPLLRLRIQGHASWQLLRRQYEVEDVMNEFWARSLPAARGRYEHVDRGGFLGFLGKILDNLLVDLARKLGAQKRGNGVVRQLDTEVDVADRGGLRRSAPETPTGNARLGELMRIARAALDETAFEAWRMHEIEDYTFAEIGFALDKTAEQVRPWLWRCRAKVAERLAREEKAD